jgi:NADPH:quinone reductase-like Zn-dependent oxidoreductase
VSLFALQFGRIHGLRVLATTTRSHKQDVLRALGAEVIDASRPDWATEARRLTGGEGVDGVVDVGGNVTLPQALAALRGDGAIAIVGFLGGFERPPDLVLPLLATRARLYGQSVGSRESFLTMNRAIVAHGLVPVIDRVWPFAEFRQAYDRVGEGGIGKTIIRVS